MILLDLFMPAMSRVAVLQGIRASEALRHVWVVMLATSSEPRDIDTVHAVGATSDLVKPNLFSDFERQMGVLVASWHDIFAELPLRDATG